MPGLLRHQPQAPTHSLVISKEHIGLVAEVDRANTAVVAHIFTVIARETKRLDLDSYRVVSNIGERAGRSVPHLHFHVLAGRDVTWPPGRVRMFVKNLDYFLIIIIERIIPKAAERLPKEHSLRTLSYVMQP